VDERERDTAVQQPSEPPSAEASAPAALWRRRPVQLAAVAVLVAAGVGTWVAVASGPDQVHVRGTLNLGLTAAVDMHNNYAMTPIAGDPCESAGGYSDITPGTAVTIGGPAGQTLGIGALSAGVETSGGYCVFSFDVQVQGGQALYTVTISHRGTQTFTPAQVASGIALTLG
jgi:hypothetical protein